MKMLLKFEFFMFTLKNMLTLMNDLEKKKKTERNNNEAKRKRWKIGAVNRLEFSLRWQSDTAETSSAVNGGGKYKGKHGAYIQQVWDGETKPVRRTRSRLLLF
jgi:hypothetical protein